MEIILRAQAKAFALKRYFTGKPCKQGHYAERLVSNGTCLECFNIRQKKAYHADLDESRRRQKVRRDSDPLLAEKKLARRVANDPSYALRSDAWRNSKGARKAAKAAGLSQYSTGTPCCHGHLGPRYVTDGKCVECNRLSCAARNEARAQTRPSLLEFRRSKVERAEAAKRRAADYAEVTRPWREAHQARQLALVRGDKTYVGRPCSSGHSGLRYTSGACVQCANEAAASDAKKSYDLGYYAKNIDHILRRTRAYNATNRVRRQEQAKRWAAANRSKVRAIKMSYKARRRAQEEGGDSTAAIHAWEMTAPKVCHWCSVKCPKKYHIDHYEPLSKGGKHVVANLVIACPKCNLKKSAKDPYEFAKAVGRLF
jgi:5-methylcytosine-specific restriction endonuclease McrA